MAKSRFADAGWLLECGVHDRAFPAATVDVGRTDGPIWQQAFGRLTYDGSAPACANDTPFDLASLTKVMATAPLSMRAIRSGQIDLGDRVADHLADWNRDDRSGVTLRHLLAHASGLPAHANLWQTGRGRAHFQSAIASLPFAYEPGQASIYSDLGFMLLGFVLADRASATLDTQFSTLSQAFAPTMLGFSPAPHARSRIAPTERDPVRDRLLQGEVHDENAAALDGIAGHAGLFGTAADVAAYARLVLRTFRDDTALGSPELMRAFATRSGEPGSSRALGWDTMLPTSSCGTLMSPAAIGHTGFTGTSLWIDPDLDLYVVLLTNRVYPTRDNPRLTALRPRFHDAVVRAILG